MKTFTKTAKSIEDAVLLAAKELSVSQSAIEYKVIDPGSKGLFGIGTKDVIIEAWVDPCSLVKAFLTDLFNKMDFESEVIVSEDDRGLSVILESEYAGAIIGRRGETLDSIQYLATLHLNRFYEREDYKRVSIDIEGYRAKREQTLVHLAESVASKVVRYRRDIVLEPMSPFERRIIHSALQNNSKVVSRSIGSEPNRKIVVTLSV